MSIVPINSAILMKELFLLINDYTSLPIFTDFYEKGDSLSKADLENDLSYLVAKLVDIKSKMLK